MKKIKPTWILYSRSNEHAAPEGFENFIPAIGTKFHNKDGRILHIEHVMYYDKDGKAVFSIRGKPEAGSI